MSYSVNTRTGSGEGNGARTPGASADRTGIDLSAEFSRVRSEIARFAERHGRRSEDIALLAVSKKKPVAAIEAAIVSGQDAFGENYVDEALEKMDALHDRHQALEWHFIGTIQSRRCDAIAERFDWAHGVDRIKVARRLSTRRPDDAAPLNVCIQLNVDDEASKSGVDLDAVDELAEACLSLPGLRLRGLMAIPAPRAEFDAQREAFASVRRCFERLKSQGAARGSDSFDTLSMGMTGDLEAAIAEGSTMVRIGTALFGARDS